MANQGVGETASVNERIDGASRPARRRVSDVAGVFSPVQNYFCA